MPSSDELIKAYGVTNLGRSVPYDKRRRALTWYSSPRDADGQLLLKNNIHTRVDHTISLRKATETALNGSNWWNGQVTDPLILIGGSGVRNAAYNQAYARLRKKLYVGGTALGVTLAGYQQSKEMIATRFGQLNQKADVAIARLATSVTPKKVAGTHLEIIFGWLPLIEDARGAMETLLPQAIPPQFVIGRAKWFVQREFAETIIVNSPPVKLHHSVMASGRVTLSAKVQISNPNLWLMERAGLLNPGSVAWDLVPWSFVVNMFVNTGQLVNSLTDFAGLTLTDVARTYSDTVVDEAHLQKSESYWHKGMYDVYYRQLSRPKSRTMHSSPPGPSLQFKLPGIDAGLIAMSAALFTQKFSTVSRLISPFLKNN